MGATAALVVLASGPLYGHVVAAAFWGGDVRDGRFDSALQIPFILITLLAWAEECLTGRMGSIWSSPTVEAARP